MHKRGNRVRQRVGCEEKMDIKILFWLFLIVTVCLAYTNGQTSRTPTTKKKPIKRKVKIKNIKYNKATRKLKGPLISGLKKLVKQAGRRKVVRRTQPNIFILG